MLESASDHLVIVFLSIVLLLMHMFKMDVRVATPSTRRTAGPRTPRRNFSHNVSSDEFGPIRMFDPDGRSTERNRRLVSR